MLELLTPSDAAKLLLLAHLRAYGGAGSGNFGHSGRPGAVGGSGYNPSELLSYLKTTTLPSETKFLLPDGTRLQFESDATDPFAQTHEDVVAHVGLDTVLKSGVIRYRADAGVNAGAPITNVQAKIIADDWNTEARSMLFVDVGVNHTNSKAFPTPVNAEALRSYVNQFFVKSLGGTGSGNFGHAGRPGVVGGSTVGVKVYGTPDATAAVHASLDKLPTSLRNESVAKEIHAFDDAKVASAKIDEYLMKHYGFTASESAKGLVDRERGVMYTMTNPRETYTQFAHTLVDRIQSPKFQKVVRDSPLPIKKPEDVFSKYFADVFTETVKLGDPASAVYDLFTHTWGWKP